MKISKQDKERALDAFSGIAEGDTIYTILRHVSRSGMQRQVAVVWFKGDYPLHPNWATSILTGYRLNRGGLRDALIVNGCGFDAAGALVADLSHALFGKVDALRHEAL